MQNMEVVKKYLDDIKKQIKKTKNSVEVNSLIENFVNSILGSEYASIWIYNPEMTSLVRKRDEKIAPMDVKKGLFYRCFITKKPAIYNTLATERRYNPLVDNFDDIDMDTIMVLPLVDNHKFIGILSVYTSKQATKEFQSDDMEMMEAIAPFIIDSIYTMQKSPEDDLSSSTRNDDSIQKLKNIEESKANLKTTKEILEHTTNVIHDMKIPSNCVFNILELIEKEIDDIRIKKYINLAKDNLNFNNRLILDNLDLISKKRNIVKVDNKLVSPSEYFSDIAENFSASMFLKNVNFNIFIDPLLPKEIKIDTIKLKRIIFNLLSNAYKFTSDGANIEFSVRFKEKDKKIHIFVKDDGVGIVKEKLLQIIESFIEDTNQSENIVSNDRVPRGLSISAKYIKDMGSQLKIYSKVGEGSTFHFEIPLNVYDEESKFDVIKNQAKVSIVIDKKNLFTANNITRYLLRMGVKSNSMKIVDRLDKIVDGTTHIIVDYSKIDDDFNSFIDLQDIKVLPISETFLGDVNKASLSKYKYYGELLYSFIDENEIPKVLIIDDDFISVSVIKAMLKSEFCEIDISYDGKEALEKMKNALENHKTYDIVFVDKDTSSLSGVEILKEYRLFEKDKIDKPIYAVAISTSMCSIDDRHLFNSFIGKPFNKLEMQKAFLDGLK